jgi:hypothetical protein
VKVGEERRRVHQKIDKGKWDYPHLLRSLFLPCMDEGPPGESPGKKENCFSFLFPELISSTPSFTDVQTDS